MKLCLLIPLVMTGLLPAAEPIPRQLADRLTDITRADRLHKAGGSGKTEAAVLAGLRWFKKNQNPDGSWSDQYPAAMTGLAMLCLLGHGELPDSPEFGNSVRMGAEWLLTTGKALQGKLGTGKNGENLDTTPYEHAIATQAVLEYYTMTRDPRFAELAKQMTAIIVAGQNLHGAWSYKYDVLGPSNLSVSGWQIQALLMAYVNDLAGAPEALDRTIPFLTSWQGRQGGYGYTQRGDKWSLTGTGLYSFQRWAPGPQPHIREGVKFIQSQLHTELKYDGEHANLHAWYYHTMALQLYGGDAWKEWNQLLKSQLVSHQKEDGSWPPCRGGPFLDVPDGIGPCYRTALCVLMLEVYYRYRQTPN